MVAFFNVAWVIKNIINNLNYELEIASLNAHHIL